MPKVADARAGGIALALALAGCLAACDMLAGATESAATESAAPDGVVAPDLLPLAVAAQIQGAWNALPFRLPADLLARIDRACRARNPDFPIGLQVVVVDARGAGFAQIYYASAAGSVASCVDVTISRTGEVDALGGASWGVGGNPLPALEPTDIVVTDHSSNGDPAISSQIAGRIGVGIVRVELVTQFGHVARATISQGWFAVWFPGSAMGGSVRGYDAFGNEVARADL